MTERNKTRECKKTYNMVGIKYFINYKIEHLDIFCHRTSKMRYSPKVQSILSIKSAVINTPYNLRVD